MTLMSIMNVSKLVPKTIQVAEFYMLFFQAFQCGLPAF